MGNDAMRPRRFLTLAFAALAPLALAACMSPTYYQPADGGNGYSSQQIADDRYRISFSGNSVTPRNVVDNYMLYRAAEITLASGHDYFVLLEHDVERNVTYRTYVDVPPGGYFYGYYGALPYGPGLWPYYDPFLGPFYGGYAEVTAEPIEKYKAYATMAVHSGALPKDNPNAYDARDVIRRLAGYILRPPP